MSRKPFGDFQHNAQLDFAIPYVNSFRKGVQASARFDEDLGDRPTEDVPLGQIIVSEEERDQFLSDDHEIEELAARIRQEGLVQPIVLSRAQGGQYRVILPLITSCARRVVAASGLKVIEVDRIAHGAVQPASPSKV